MKSPLPFPVYSLSQSKPRILISLVMSEKFEIILEEANSEEARFHLANDRDANGNPIPNRKYVTGIDRKGSAAKMAVCGQMPIVVHGYECEGSKTPCTLIIFEWNAERARGDKRLREVTIEMSFTAHGKRGEAEARAKSRRARGKGVSETYWDPEVCDFAPRGTTWYNRTSHKVTEKSQWEVSLQANFGQNLSAGPKYHWERSDTVDLPDAIQLSGAFTSSSGSNRPNGVRWVMLENASQRSGVPTFLRTAVLLKRREGDDGKFLGHVKVECSVSPFHDLKEVFLKMIKKVPKDEPIFFNPSKSTGHHSFPSSDLASVDLDKEFSLISSEPPPGSLVKAETGAKKTDPEDSAYEDDTV